MAHFIDDSGSGPLAVEGYALKLEYTLEKYFTDYKCISEIKKFRHSGNFPVYYKTPDNPYTYMTTVRVTDRKKICYFKILKIYSRYLIIFIFS